MWLLLAVTAEGGFEGCSANPRASLIAFAAGALLGCTVAGAASGADSGSLCLWDAVLAAAAFLLPSSSFSSMVRCSSAICLRNFSAAASSVSNRVIGFTCFAVAVFAAFLRASALIEGCGGLTGAELLEGKSVAGLADRLGGCCQNAAEVAADLDALWAARGCPVAGGARLGWGLAGAALESL